MTGDLAKKAADSWFTKHEKELIEKARHRHSAEERQKKTEEDRRIRELHFMHCPKCGKKMKEIHVKGITLDQCGDCQGIFFDGGELDLLLEKTVEDQKGFFRKLAHKLVPGV